jgi:AraC-like DNA-binding protein
MAGEEFPPEVRLAMDYVSNHFFSKAFRGGAAKFVGICPDHLDRLFRKFLDCTFNGYVQLVKMQEAEVMFRVGSRVKEVAVTLGLNLRTLERWYRERYGVAPGNRC